jgi:hypothetical protein
MRSPSSANAKPEPSLEEAVLAYRSALQSISATAAADWAMTHNNW